ncbi:MAG: ABC transporter ATP-binding protein [Acholeplasmataceae bacterium]|jgi:oligopeptide transport system ATP-binding protein|nr:ABC transporter ATP-binding protein [Acholeplasmataceae bacterium]
MKILEVKNLHTSFFTHMGEVRAVRGITFDVEKGDILGIVGESGSGKSVTSLSVMGLIDHPGKIKEGEIIFDGKDLSKMTHSELSNIRGNDISMIFQDPMTSLNPVFRIGNQITDIIRRHTNVSKQEAKERALELLNLVNIPEPETRIRQYPHQFSGGMRQRAMIAMALSCNPKLLIADEPTTALDVTIQAQILELLKELKDKKDLSIILITHDLGVIAESCNKVIVMYGGLIMEQGTVLDIFENPQHPYTRGLHQSVPKNVTGEKKRLIPIGGTPPDLLEPPLGCPFYPRCKHAMEICAKKLPPLFKLDEKHQAACWLHDMDAPQTEDYIQVKETSL